MDKLIILVNTFAAPIYVSPDIADELSKNTQLIKEALDYAFPSSQPNIAGTSDYNYHMGHSVVRLIALKETRKDDSPLYTKEMASLAHFDHEIGHLAVKNGFSSNDNLAECAADAYAALRHIQRFHQKTDFFEYANTAQFVVFGISPEHYTDSAIQKVKQLSEQMDVSKLSLRETVTRAGEIAELCQINAETLKKISKAFIHARGAYFTGSMEECYRRVLAVMKENRNDPDIFGAGKSFLSHPDVKKAMEDLAKTQRFWKKAIEFIEPSTPSKTTGWFKRLLHLSPG